MSGSVNAGDSDDSFGWLPLSGTVTERNKEFSENEVTHNLACASFTKKEPNLSDYGDGESKTGVNDTVLDEIPQDETETPNIARIFSVGDLSSDDEIWVMQCPINIKEEELVGRRFNIEKQPSCNLHPLIGNRILKMKVTGASEKILGTCLLPSSDSGSFKPVVFPYAGHIILTESIKREQVVEEGHSSSENLMVSPAAGYIIPSESIKKEQLVEEDHFAPKELNSPNNGKQNTTKSSLSRSGKRHHKRKREDDESESSDHSLLKKIKVEVET